MPNVAKKFYPEIQGLRAVSIIAVILFHFGIHILPGGYIGVDIFFVISGFLITKMIAYEIERGSFSLSKFYKNRVVRLLPNLFLMVVATVVISYFVLKPYDFFQYGKSLQFSAVYLTNMVFARQQGYFDMSRDAKPLLHTWSLSIEEQFYLLFPLLLILLYKLRSHRIAVLLVIALASLWVRFSYIQQHLPTEGFFSFAGRVWEFVVGALIALLPATLRDRLSNNEALSLFGLLLIFASLLFLDEGVPYSGLLLIIPCLATAMIIISSHGTRSGRLLSGKYLVFIGGLSYSLYLWHWPLIVWLHNADLAINRHLLTLILILLTGAVSFVAWRYVEEPFRRNRERFSGRFIAVSTLGFAIFCISVGGFIYAKDGLENRFPNWVAVKKNISNFDFRAATGTQIRYTSDCSINADVQSVLRSCAFGDLNSNNRFLVLGDSHTAAWYPAFQAAAEAKHLQGVLATLPGCPPLFAISSFDGAKDICAKDFDENIGALVATKQFSKVYLVAFWSMYSEGDPNNQPSHFISDAQTTSHDSAESQRVMDAHLQSTIRHLQALGIEVILVHSVPTLPKVIQDLPDDYSQTLAHLHRQNRFMIDFVRNHGERLGFTVLDPTDIFCGTGSCVTRHNGNVLYVDNNHISPAGASILVPLIASSM